MHVREEIGLERSLVPTLGVALYTWLGCRGRVAPLEATLLFQQAQEAPAGLLTRSDVALGTRQAFGHAAAPVATCLAALAAARTASSALAYRACETTHTVGTLDPQQSTFKCMAQRGMDMQRLWRTPVPKEDTVSRAECPWRTACHHSIPPPLGVNGCTVLC